MTGMRKRRIIQEGATYHVTAKTNRGEFILYTDEVKELFICVMEDAEKKFDQKVIQYTIMSNHIHIIIKPKKGISLSIMMQWMLSVFAIRFNKLFGLTGHVWYDRFKSKIISTFRQLVNTFHYISENPVKAGICKNAADYIWGGLYELKKGRFRLLDPPDEWVKLII